MSFDDAQIGTAKKACVACGQEFDADVSLCPQDGIILTPLIGGAIENLIGKVFADSYEVLEELGTGSMGRVYKAKHVLMKRLVAIKVLQRTLVSEPIALQRFQQEAQAASSLNHPHILTIFDFGVSQEGLPYMVMDYLEGMSLDKCLAHENLLLADRSVGIFVQVCSGLAHAHNNGVIHRDLKPSNIMLTTLDNQSDYVKIVDFGLAKIIVDRENETKHLTKDGQVCGSPLYMSPEQCQGQPLDQRSDIYSLGCLMYRTITGSPPFLGKNIAECLQKHVHESPPTFKQVNSEIVAPDDLEAVVLKCLSKIPEQRFQSMAELKEALLTIFPGAGSLAFSHTNILTQSQALLNPPNKVTKTAEANVNDQNTILSATSSEVDRIEERAKDNDLSPERKKRENLPLIAGMGAFLLLLALIVFAYKGQESKSPELANDNPAPNHMHEQLYEQYRGNAHAYYDRGDFYGAERSVKLALKEARHLGKNNPEIVSSLNLLGKIYYAESRIADARSTFSEVLQLIDPQANQKTQAVADALNGLALVDSAEKKFPEALSLFQRSLAIRQSLNGAQHTDVADSLLGIAELSMRQGQYKEAILKLNDALTIRQKALGLDHPECAVVLNDLGQAYQWQGKLTDAEKCYTKALKIREEKLSDKNPATADCLTLIGTLKFQRGKLAEAEDLFERALAIKENALGTNSASLPEILRALAIVYMQEHRYPDAQAALKRALSISQSSEQKSDTDTNKSRRIYAQLLTITGHKEDAQAVLKGH